jgi:hypothetical protein
VDREDYVYIFSMEFKMGCDGKGKGKVKWASSDGVLGFHFSYGGYTPLVLW